MDLHIITLFLPVHMWYMLNAYGHASIKRSIVLNVKYLFALIVQQLVFAGLSPYQEASVESLGPRFQPRFVSCLHQASLICDSGFMGVPQGKP